MNGVSGRDFVAAGALAALVLALAIPSILLGEMGSKAYDHIHFHLPLVRAWAAGWPVVDLRDYPSATGPLYHWIMAGVARVMAACGHDSSRGASAPALQAASATFGVCAVLGAYRWLRATLDSGTAFIAATALAASPYLIGNAIWMMTDNLSLALVIAVVGSAAFGTRKPARSLTEGVLAALAVATRQINLWLLAPLAAASILEGRFDRKTLLALLVSAALPIAMLAAFVLLWGGLVPPMFQSMHASRMNPAAIGFALTLVGAYGACLLVGSVSGFRVVLRNPFLLIGALVVGAALASIGPSFASLEAGRNGGWLWRLVAVVPVFGDRSPVMLIGGAWGAVVLCALLIEAHRAARAREAIIVLVAFAGFVVAHVANAQIFQRYYDPMVVLTLIWLGAAGTPALAKPSHRTRMAFAILAAQQAVFAIAVV